jgi:hypothetical protein
LEYSASNTSSTGSWQFTDRCPARGTILLRNSVCHGGELFEVRSVSAEAFQSCHLWAAFISRTVGSLGEGCFGHSDALQTVAFEAGSLLCEIGPSGFSGCQSLRSIAMPSLVARLGHNCFQFCESLQSVMFERPSRLAAINYHAFFLCRSLNRFCIPASVRTIRDFVFAVSGISSIEIEEGSVSFRVVNDLLVDFEVRSLLYVIGSPESIVIPSSIEELRPFCCAWKESLRTVEFESGSNLRSIGPSAFHGCASLKSICIPSSVEFLRNNCFESCYRLQTVTFGSESKLRLIEQEAFEHCGSLKLVSLPGSAKVLGR